MSNYYLVDAYNGWFVCYADNIREARKQGTYEFGRGMTKEVRRASAEEVDKYCVEKSIDLVASGIYHWKLTKEDKESNRRFQMRTNYS